MQIEQRLSRPEESFQPSPRLWAPAVLRLRRGKEVPVSFEPTATDAYLVVEDLDEAVAVLEHTPWPALDAAGRLAFSGTPVRFTQDLTALSRLIERHRRRQRQPAPDRPLRVGDVFLVRGRQELEGARIELRRAEQLIDVSAAAREAAKRALYGAASSAVEPDYAEQFDLTGAPSSEVEKGQFDVRQQPITSA